jgi:D-beta-D-heptose 7-phosphate kinase/D-beta-D-heptose 1-phosphate adenosyltransferase
MSTESRQKLLSCVQEFNRQHIVVLGDLILDQYIWGEVERISPEAPIPILKVTTEEVRVGGAASVVANVHALECTVTPIGLLGEDEAGEKIISLLTEMGITTDRLIVTKRFQTITKKRVLTKQQQLVRIDYESSTHELPDFSSTLLTQIKIALKEADGIIISDYAKGTLNPRVIKETITEANKLKIPIICDPGKGVDISYYKGVTTIKPNRLETEQTTGIKLTNQSNILQAAQKLQEMCQSQFLSLSLDKDGILLYRNRDNYQFIKTEAKEVYDVTGAGDMVTSLLGVLLADGVEAEVAVQLANIAAELEISHLGVVPIPWNDIKNYLEQDSLSQKIVPLNLLQDTLIRDTPLIFTNGYFDKLSAGHLRFLIEIAQIKGKLIVAINSDKSIFKVKGSYPLLNQHERARLLASLENVYRIIIFEDLDASHLIEMLRPNIVVKGENFKHQEIPELSAIKKVKAKIRYIEQFDW